MYRATPVKTFIKNHTSNMLLRAQRKQQQNVEGDPGSSRTIRGLIFRIMEQGLGGILIACLSRDHKGLPLATAPSPPPTPPLNSTPGPLGPISHLPQRPQAGTGLRSSLEEATVEWEKLRGSAAIWATQTPNKNPGVFLVL